MRLTASSRHLIGYSLAAVLLFATPPPCRGGDPGSLPGPPVAVQGRWQLSYHTKTIDGPGAAVTWVIDVTQTDSRFAGAIADGSTITGSAEGHDLQFVLSCPQHSSATCAPHLFVGTATGAYIRGYVTRPNQPRWRGITREHLGEFEAHLQREFVLTFDDGPLPGHTDRVLATLASQHDASGAPIRAAFFTLGDAPTATTDRLADYAPFELWRDKGSIARNPQLAARIAAAGHYLGNHTRHHAWPWWPWNGGQADIAAELRGWEEDMQKAGLQPRAKLFRPPYLARSGYSAEVAAQLGYRTVLGHTIGDAEPGATLASIEQKALTVMEQCNDPGPCTLILHDIREVTADHLAEIIGFLREKGYRLASFAPLSDNDSHARK